jgi:arabinogalactan oligomer/maltooligosaccharide transport system permease protein
MFLFPALIVMAVITFYPLVFQVWMSFTDYGLTNLRATAPARTTSASPTTGGSSTTTSSSPTSTSLRILVFNLFWAFSNVVIHVVSA